MSYLDNLEQLQFELDGGWFGVIARCVFFISKWAIIAVIFTLAIKYIL